MEAVLRPRARLPRAVPVVVAAAWVAMVAAQLTGRDGLVHQHALIEQGLPIVGVAAFALAWVLMIVAMMVPSTLGMVGLYARTSAKDAHPRRALVAFLGGYVAVWTCFGIVALGADVGLHHAVDAVPWIADRPWVVLAGALALAGAFQFSALRERCLHVCRHPFAYLFQHYRPGERAGLALGWSHGLFCLGCCWALMVLMFAVGVANLAWMAVLTAVMVYEKVGRHGEALAPTAGVVLLALALLVAAHPGWLPTSLGSGA